MKKISMIVAAVFMTACTPMEKKVVDRYEEDRHQSQGRIYKTITNFTPALQCMDHLLADKKVRHSRILIESLNDKTDSIKVGSRDMMISAISEMTKKSKKVRLITYGNDSTNLISFLKTAGQNSPYEKVPHYSIRGSISQFDKKVVQKDRSLGLFHQDGGGLGAAQAASLDVITLDLSAVDTHDMGVVAGATSKNTVAVYSHGNSLDADARIDKLGTYFDMSLSRSQGKSQAVRNLMELGAIELIGKLHHVPYWQCLGTKSPEDLYTPKTQRLNPNPPLNTTDPVKTNMDQKTAVTPQPNPVHNKTQHQASTLSATEEHELSPWLDDESD
ncbi:MAG: hypothetical protein ACWA5U_09080 [bacterium]